MRSMLDEVNRWYACAGGPLKSVSKHVVKPGTRWRANLYRVDGLCENPQQNFLCSHDPHHVPGNFRTLVFTR